MFPPTDMLLYVLCCGSSPWPVASGQGGRGHRASLCSLGPRINGLGCPGISPVQDLGIAESAVWDTLLMWDLRSAVWMAGGRSRTLSSSFGPLASRLDKEVLLSSGLLSLQCRVWGSSAISDGTAAGRVARPSASGLDAAWAGSLNTKSSTDAAC